MEGMDRELDAILERMARRYVSRKTSPCCKKEYPVGYEIKGVEEVSELTSNCRVVFINFYSPMCPYCDLFYPVYMEIGRKYNGNAVFARQNVATNPELAWRYNVLMTPTTIVLVDGKPAYQIQGYIPKEYFEETVKNILVETQCIEKQ